MAATTLDLYRLGNSTSAKLDNLRPGADVVVESRNGQNWVKAGSGGPSAFEMPSGLRGKHWYKLSAGASYDDSRINLWNDAPNHWVFDVAKDMLLADFTAALSEVNPKFVHV